MAFNLSITKKGEIDWVKLNHLSKRVDRNFATIFPIQEKDFSKESGLGISININNNANDYWNHFEEFLNELIKDGFLVVELYEGRVIELEEVKDLRKIIGS